MKTEKIKKRIVVLPKDFQEVLITHEMIFEKQQINIDIIRKLLGMEYYDSVNKQELHMFYFNKCNKLLQNENVIIVLDTLTNKVNFGDNKDIKLFEPDPYKFVYTGLKCRRKSMSDKELSFVTADLGGNGYVPAFTEGSSNSENLYRNKFTKTDFKAKKNENKYINKLRAQEEVCNLDEKLNKILFKVDKELGDQKNKFEEMKKNKLLCQSNKIKIKPYAQVNTVSTNNTESNYSSTPSCFTLEDELVSKDLLYKQQKETVIQSMMLRDIEEFIEKNMKEMHMALDELRLSFEEEIQDVDEEVFPDVVNGLREDMKVELENLREQYEDQRRLEVEKIRHKYLKQR